MPETEEKTSNKKKKNDKDKDGSFLDLFYRDIASRAFAEPEHFEAYRDLIVSSIDVVIIDKNCSIEDNGLRTCQSDYHEKLNGTKEKFKKNLALNQILFEVGDKIDPALFADSERGIRQNTIYRDAIILVVPKENSEYAEVIVVAQTNRHYVLQFTGGIGDLRTGIDIYDFMGIPQRFYVYGTGYFLNPQNPYDVTVGYRISNIAKSRINLRANYSRQNLGQESGFTLNRNFFAYNTKWAGRVRANWGNEKFGTTEFSEPYNVTYNEQDFWLARSFAMPKINDKHPFLRFIVSSRISRLHYKFTPEDAVNLRDNMFYLGSFGFANRDFYAFENLYNFRQYDYIPKGFNISFIGGFEADEFTGQRGYTAFKTNYNKYYEKFGFLQYGLGYGHFFTDKYVEQPTLNLSTRYFTNRFNAGKLGFRQFINANTVLSYNRPTVENINFSGNFKGQNSNQFVGSKSFVVNLESVFYTNVKWWNSRGNFFFFSDFGWVSDADNEVVFTQRFQHGYGGGIRFQSRNVGINFFEISFGFYPNGGGLNNSGFIYNIASRNRFQLGTENLFDPSIISPDIR